MLPPLVVPFPSPSCSSSLSPPFRPPSPLPALSPSTIGAIAFPALSTSLNSNAQLSTSTGAFHGSLGRYMWVLSALTRFHRSAGLGVTISSVYSEFHSFKSIRPILTFPVLISAILVLSPMVCVSICAIGVSVWSPQAFNSFEHRLAASIGKFGGLSFFRVILMFSGAFAGLFGSVSTLRTSLCPIDMSIWLPTPFRVSKSGLVRFCSLSQKATRSDHIVLNSILSATGLKPLATGCMWSRMRLRSVATSPLCDRLQTE